MTDKSQSKIITHSTSYQSRFCRIHAGLRERERGGGVNAAVWCIFSYFERHSDSSSSLLRWERLVGELRDRSEKSESFSCLKQ